MADRAELQAKCQGMGRMIDTAVDNVGRIITDLRPSILDHQGLWAALEWQAQEFIDSAELDSELQLHVAAGVQPPDGRRWRSRCSASSRRCCPTWRGMPRRSACRSASRWTTRRSRCSTSTCATTASGAEPQALNAARSYGVMGMRERAAQFGGKLTIDSAPGHGTRVRLVMPLAARPSHAS